MSKPNTKLIVQREGPNGNWSNWDWINRWTQYPEEIQIKELVNWIKEHENIGDKIKYRIVRRIVSYELV